MKMAFFSPPLLWDMNETVNFKYRDLKVEFSHGEVRFVNEIYLDVNAINNGFLSTGDTDVQLYFDDPDTGQFITLRDVDPLCGMKTAGCNNYFEIFNEIFINQEGHIYAIINKDGAVSECAYNNIAEIHCYTAPRMQFYILRYWLWYK